MTNLVFNYHYDLCSVLHGVYFLGCWLRPSYPVTRFVVEFHEPKLVLLVV